MKTKSFLLAFLLFIVFNENVTSQVNPLCSQLNNYKYFVIKSENTDASFKDAITKKVQQILAAKNFPALLDNSVLFSNKYDQCQIITLVYSASSPTYSSGEISCSFKFVDCNNTNIVANTISEKQPFVNEKNYLKSIVKCSSVMDGYTYNYVDKNGTLLAQENTVDQQQMRGSSDPLKGLNVSKSKEMVVGKYYALIIGIDKYKGIFPTLNTAVNDAKGVQTILSNYKFDVIHSLLNEQATRDKIIKEFEWLVANVKQQDNLLIYYSGHGEYKQELNKGFWVPCDAETASISNYISNNDIHTFLGGIKSKHTLLVSDACFSGDIFRGNTISAPFEESDKYYSEVHALDSRQAMTSGGIEPVMDGGKDGHSVFAYYFLKTLGDNKNKYFDASQLYNALKIPVINNSEQTPKLAAVKNAGDAGGQFIFIRK